jgi:hypothetical protein
MSDKLDYNDEGQVFRSYFKLARQSFEMADSAYGIYAVALDLDPNEDGKKAYDEGLKVIT